MVVVAAVVVVVGAAVVVVGAVVVVVGAVVVVVATAAVVVVAGGSVVVSGRVEVEDAVVVEAVLSEQPARRISTRSTPADLTDPLYRSGVGVQ